MNIGIIGCGIVGVKRSKLLGNNNLKAVADIKIDRAYSLASDNSGVKIFSDYRDLLNLPEIDIVIVSTTNNMLSKITLDAIKLGKHVLVEKPCGINSKEIYELIKAQRMNNVKVKTGFNHRSHLGFIKARELVDSGIIGDLMFIRAHYGIGGRIGYDKEWRSDPKISGGGHTIDQGVHIIDLSRWFLGDLFVKSSSIKTYYWDMVVEDNAFMILENYSGKTAFLSTSCTEWKNTFLFEIYGKLGKIKIEGLGKSYGIEKVTLYKMLPQMGVPETTTWEYPFEDISWQKEIEDLVDCIKNNKEAEPNLKDAYEVLKIVDEIYKRDNDKNDNNK